MLRSEDGLVFENVGRSGFPPCASRSIGGGSALESDTLIYRSHAVFSAPQTIKTDRVPCHHDTHMPQEAIRRIRSTGANVRTQAPLINHVNADPATWASMWRLQTRLGAIPYYMFVERDTGARRYFEVHTQYVNQAHPDTAHTRSLVPTVLLGFVCSGHEMVVCSRGQTASPRALCRCVLCVGSLALPRLRDEQPRVSPCCC